VIGEQCVLGVKVKLTNSVVMDHVSIEQGLTSSLYITYFTLVLEKVICYLTELYVTCLLPNSVYLGIIELQNFRNCAMKFGKFATHFTLQISSLFQHAAKNEDPSHYHHDRTPSFSATTSRKCSQCISMLSSFQVCVAASLYQSAKPSVMWTSTKMPLVCGQPMNRHKLQA